MPEAKTHAIPTKLAEEQQTSSHIQLKSLYTPADFGSWDYDQQLGYPGSSIRLLDPIERNSEVLFGLIMVLTFTGSLRVTGAEHDDVDRMLVAALGCNLAWGIIDAVMYLISVLSQRGHNTIAFGG